MSRQNRKNNERKNNIVKYPRFGKTNMGIIIFAFLAIYLFAVVFTYATSKHIAGYEVKSGSLAIDNTYRGVILRSERIVDANKSGYVNYYAREDEKAGYGALVYTIDESGKLNDLLSEGFISKTELTNEDMNELKTQIINYRNTYNDFNFASVYDFKNNIENTANKLSNLNVMNSLSDIGDTGVMEMVDFGYNPESGIVVYNYDGLEELHQSGVNAEIFDEELHTKTQLAGNSLVSAGDPAYKLVTDENWYVVIAVDDERYDQLKEHDYVKIRFLKTDETSYGKVELFENEGQKYCKFGFTNSMITFATDRYIDIELLIDSTEGLKIPLSAIVEKEFYLIPVDYITTGGDSETQGFLRETYLEDGSVTTEFLPIEVYRQTDEYYYVDTSVLRLGDSIIQPDTQNKYSVANKDTLIGVYNMNKGYADFSQITILYQNREYAIVKSNTEYGLKVYDHIVLDGSAVEEQDFVYE